MWHVDELVWMNHTWYRVQDVQENGDTTRIRLVATAGYYAPSRWVTVMDLEGWVHRGIAERGPSYQKGE